MSSISNANPKTQTTKQLDENQTITVKKYPKYITGKSTEYNNKVLDCFICCVKEKWKDHKTSFQHTSNLQYFVKNFEELSESYVKCKLCNNHIHKGSLKKHASKVHKLIPWYRPIDEFNIYFKNFIKPTDETYNCLLCDNKFKSWNLALNHIKTPHHQQLLKDCIREDISEAGLTIKLCKRLITNYIFPHGASRSRCLVCNFNFEDYDAADKHIVNETHKKNLSTNNINTLVSFDNSMSSLFKNLTINYSKTCTSDDYVETSNPESRASTSSGYGSTFTVKDINLNDNNSNSNNQDSNESTKSSETNFSKSEVISNKKPKIKMEEKPKVKVEASLAVSDCKSTISNGQLSEIDSKSTLPLGFIQNNFFPINKDATPVEKWTELENLVLRLFKNYIYVSDNDYFCNLCSKNFSSLLSTSMHLDDSKHKELLLKKQEETHTREYRAPYLPNFTESLIRNNIFPRNLKELECFTCKASMPTKNSVEEHIKSQLHISNRESACNFSKLPIEGKQLLLLESKTDLIIYFKNFIEKGPTDYYCHLCQSAFTSLIAVMMHVKTLQHCKLLSDQNSKVITEPHYTLYFYELCIRNSIFRLDINKLKCFACEGVHISKKMVESHIEDPGHQTKYDMGLSSIGTTMKPKTILPQTKSIPAKPTVPSKTMTGSNKDKKITIDQNSKSTVEKKIINTNQLISKCDLEKQILKCFENFIYVCDSYYFCNLCEEKFLSLPSMLLHLNDSKHKNLLEKRRQEYGMSEEKILYTPKFYELLVRNNVFQFDSMKFKCLSCECFISGYNCAEQHICGSQHKINHKFKFDKIKAATEEKNTLVENMLPETKETFAQYFGNFIEKTSKDYYCHICRINLSSSEVMVHMKIPKHLNLIKHYKKDEKIQNVLYYSELCVRNSIFCWTAPGLNCFTCIKLVGPKNEIEEHVKSQEHKTKYTLKSNNILPSKQPLIVPQPSVNSKNKPIVALSTEIKTSSPELSETSDYFLTLFKNSIFMRQDDYFCNLCEVSISTSDIKKHIKSIPHFNKINFKKDKILNACNIVSDNNFEKLVQNNVFPVNKSTIKCYSCNFYFSHYESIKKHINNDKNHAGVPKKLQTTPVVETIEVENLSKRKKRSRAKKNSSKQSGNSPSKVLSCDIYKYTDTKRDHSSCHVCRKKIRSRNVLHVHLSGHFWQIFTDIDIDALLALAKLQSERALVLKPKTSKQVFSDERRDELIKERSKEDDKNSKAATKSKTSQKSKSDEQKVKNKDQKRQEGRKITLDDLDVDENMISNKIDIYKMDEEIQHVIKLSLSRICIISQDKIYCMICRKNVDYSLQIVYKHFRSIQHSYFLTQMVQDHTKFERFPNEFSDFRLAREMMEDKSDRHVVCFVCNPIKPTVIPNKTEALNHHINSEKHQNKITELNNNLQQLINDLHSRFERCWFNVQKYWCVICSKKFKLEHKFCQHLKSKKHLKMCQKFIRFENLVYDFCPTCAILYYGFKNTFTYHSDCQQHIFYADKHFYSVSRLPSLVEELVINAEENVMNKLAKLEENKALMKKEEQLLLKDLKIAIKNYGNAKIYPFGSRITGLGSMTSDLDIFLDCYDSYYKGTELDDVFEFITKVEELLKKEEETWTIKKTIINCRVPIIKLKHNTTGIDCDISFTNGLTTENTKLVKLYIDKYPLCKKLILFMRDWINACNLSGEDGISNYAISWMVIYYLQTKFIVPSVAELLKAGGKSRVIGGWETGVANDIILPHISIHYTFKDLLRGFFIMCAGFDYRNNIFCPLLGRPVRKIDFVVPSKLTNLPKEMVPYKKYVKYNHKKVEHFRSDSVMGIQDPFDLSHNLTKAVKKSVMYRFRSYCAMSAN